MTADEPLAGSTRRSARGLPQDVETVWSRLRAEFTLQDRFWIGFLFGTEAPKVAELVARSRDLAQSEVRRVDVIRLDGLEDVGPALGRLLAQHAEDLAMTWITDVGGSITERAQIWTRLLRRLNERRDALRAAHPCGLVLVCPRLAAAGQGRGAGPVVLPQPARHPRTGRVAGRGPTATAGRRRG